VKLYIEQVNEKALDGNPFYSFEEVEEYFAELCGLKSDHFAHLFVFYKDQIIVNEAEEYSNIYDLNDEILLFKEQGVSCKAELNKIRIFHNDSAAYISDSLLTSFELYSFTIHKPEFLNLPLLFVMKKKDGISVVNHESQFVFYNIINDVYKNVEDIMNNMVDFYISVLISLFPPDKFPCDPIFSKQYFIPGKRGERDKIEGDFQFLMTISRHITYIQYFRQIVLKYSDRIIELNAAEKKIANVYLLYILKKYFSLYLDNYKKIDEKSPVSDNNKLYGVKITYTRFLSTANDYIERNIFDLIR
jgi:hypothetical protein